MDDIFNKVKAIIVDNLGIEDDSIITLESNLREDLGADSLDAAQIIIDLEDEFNIEIDSDNTNNITYVKDLVEYIENNIN